MEAEAGGVVLLSVAKYATAYLGSLRPPSPSTSYTSVGREADDFVSAMTPSALPPCGDPPTRAMLNRINRH